MFLYRIAHTEIQTTIFSLSFYLVYKLILVTWYLITKFCDSEYRYFLIILSRFIEIGDENGIFFTI